MSDVFVTINPFAHAELVSAARKFIDRVGDQVLAHEQRLVPKETWSLHDSLETESGIEGDVVFVDIGVNDEFTSAVGRHPADYVDFVEHGTSRMQAEPFQLPALMQVIGNLEGVEGVVSP